MASLRHSSYRLLWTSTLFTSAGNWIQQVTIGWLAFNITGSPFQVGLITGLRGLPMLAMGPIAGVIADRVDRRKLLMATQLLLMAAAVAFAIPVLLGTVTLWEMYVFSLVTGLGWALQNPVRQSLVANSVPPEDLTNAVALNSMAFNSMRIVGPGSAGVLIEWLGPGPNFLFQALMYVGVFAMVLMYRPMFRNDYTAARRSSALANLAEGLRYVLSRPILLTLIGSTTVAMIFVMSFISSQMPVYAGEVLNNTSGSVLGLLLMLYGAGGFIGAFIAGMAGGIRRKGLLILSAGALQAIAVFVFSNMSILALAGTLLVVAGIFQNVTMATTNATVQSIIPDRLRGRVMGIYMVAVGTMPVGSLLAGTLAEVLGSVKLALSIGALTALGCVAVIALLSKEMRQLKL